MTPTPRHVRLLRALLWLVCGCGMAAASASPLRVVTEELPPYNMTVNGKVVGLSTEVVEAVLDEVGTQTTIQSMPWARAYDMALHEDNVLIYSIAHTAQREHLFHWIGVVAPTRWYLYSAAANPVTLNSLEQARTHQIGTVVQDVGEDYLLAHHFVIGENLQSSNKYEFNYQKLVTGRLDLWITDEHNAAYLARQAGADPQTSLVASLPLPELGEDLSLAFSLSTPAATVQRFRDALQTLHRNGKYDAIVRKWR